MICDTGTLVGSGGAIAKVPNVGIHLMLVSDNGEGDSLSTANDINVGYEITLWTNYH
jgi:hypothetical protein